jgi:hypothetical protein
MLMEAKDARHVRDPARSRGAAIYTSVVFRRRPSSSGPVAVSVGGASITGA